MNTIETLNLLLKTCRDGQEGFRSCAAAVSSEALRALFNRHGEECARSADEIRSVVLRHGGRADDDTSLAGDLHRGWVIAKGALTGRTERAILAECERGEDIALRDYRLALEQDLPADVREVVAKQFRGVQRNHDQIKALRDETFEPAIAGRGLARRSGAVHESADSGEAGVPGRALQWSLAQIRIHPVRSLGLLAVLGLVGWRAMAPRSHGIAAWLRRLR